MQRCWLAGSAMQHISQASDHLPLDKIDQLYKAAGDQAYLRQWLDA